MKKIVIITLLTILTACSVKPELKGYVGKVNSRNDALVLTKTDTGKDTVVVCYPKTRYERFSVGQSLTLVYRFGRYQSK